ncbi:MAG: SDR family NAD(P)-dependent oxidoreductase [Propionibacteriaceae bacterium]|nr:SDR family NAD(P)-dependent oxidoreductase [Propionibacteriaceae bacterium]
MTTENSGVRCVAGGADIIEIAHRFGDDEYARAGGGNCSVKADGVLWIKPSGTRMKTLVAGDLVPLRIDSLLEALHSDDPVEGDPVVAAARAARVGDDDGRRPSVEILFHALLPERLVLHLHPLVANALTCNEDAIDLAERLFGDDVVVVDYIDPGIPLARGIEAARTVYTQRTGATPPGLIFLRNHGIIAAADTIEELAVLVTGMTAKIQAAIDQACVAKEGSAPATKGIAADEEEALPGSSLVVQVGPLLRGLLGTGQSLAIIASDVSDLVASQTGVGKPIVSGGPLIPDQIVYAGSLPCVIPSPAEADVRAAVADYVKQHGHNPVVCVIPGQAAFAAGADQASAANALAVFTDALRVARDANLLGVCRVMDERERGFIENWEAEAYRKKVAASTTKGRLWGKVAVVTGAAQGFGLGISQALAAQGAHVVLADLNIDLARAEAEKLCGTFGAGRALAVAVNVSDEASQRQAVSQIVAAYGGLDLFVSNAGIARAASVTEQRIEDFDLVTAVNYKGYFLGVRAVAPIMAAQHRVRPDTLFDIVEVNSKSGLEGSKRNFAYAGSKFGGIGLTQSFALELIESGIKVNAVCPGNFLDGPLWSDPERGLFVQYLEAGKVPGAKHVADVRAYYESKVPMGRGCLPDDVARAVMYLVEQQYETGQALPVTGGQVMLS